jgi:hypothetical protein
MARDHKLNARSPYRLDDIKILFAGDPEYSVHAFVFQGPNE